MADTSSHDFSTLTLVKTFFFHSLDDTSNFINFFRALRHDFRKVILSGGFLVKSLESALIRVLDQVSFLKTQRFEGSLKHLSSVDDRVSTQPNQDFTNTLNGSVSDVKSFGEAFFDQWDKNFLDHKLRVEDAKN